ncbi:50S ribosomal protein L10 [Endozoicomonas sp. SM1973]|uniref:Large ribosomal subunit protein uL10 n=2 Tax=Spartinivicinus TaxID=2768738 RepID=A0A853IL95_9GAMM|nr:MULTISPECIES: 50S ribosomal protein L10 [Spartinivicinus]MCX4026304.1 50S ribosomal protein L10 [Spartinivicinus marinus]MDE1464718.1 50S ribosomal protein L10 [Spartinivicinus sp. A2-2]NYZ68506.1 50S ribosomal protein L10 [Spartinivicinus marinus]
MALKLEDKKAIVAEVNEAAKSALSAVIADYRGLTVDQMTALRKQAREGSVYLKVVRNTLARRAVEGTDYECLQEALTGPTVIAFSNEDPGAAARVIQDFAKENKELEVKALSIGGQLLGPEQIDVLAKMPTLDQARAMLMSVMIAPVTKLARTLNEFPAKITRAVAAVRDQKKEAA